MNQFSDSDRALIARGVAALRRHGWPAGRAMNLVAERLPAGPARDELGRLAAALERGEQVTAEGDEPLLQLLAQGENAGAEALAEAARAFELSIRAQRSAATAIRSLVLSTGVVLLIAAAAAFFVAPVLEGLFRDMGTLPGPTLLAFGITRALPWAAPVLLAALAVVAWRWPFAQRLSGARGFRAASALRLYAASLHAGLPEAPGYLNALGLDRFAQLLAERLAARSGVAHAARVLADELEADATRSWLFFVWAAPVVGFLALLVVVLPLLGALYLPIFSIARSVS